MRKIYRSLLTATVATFLIVGAVPSSADAASCYGSSCTGEIPTEQGCSDDALTLKSSAISSGYDSILLRYSAECGAVWARGKAQDNLGPHTASIERRSIATGNVSYKTVDFQNTTKNTRMFGVSASYDYRACISNPLGTACTGWF